MIRQRNQNKIKQNNQNKPKLQKKAVKAKIKKQKVQTDAQDDQQNNKQIPTVKNLVPTKPKKSLPKFQFESNPKDQAYQYEDQIITYLKEQQNKYKIDENNLKFHKTMNPKIRNFLVKYIFKMVWKYKSKRSTLFLAVYCLDSYLSKSEKNVQNNTEYVIIAQASLHIAMKFEQIYPPQIKEWTVNAQQIKQILTMQASILAVMNFQLNYPSVYYFEQYFQKKFCQSNRYLENKENLYLQELKINLIADACLFDVNLYEYQPIDLAKNIRRMVYNIQPPFKEQRLVLNIKWALERNKSHIEWLKQQKYKELWVS